MKLVSKKVFVDEIKNRDRHDFETKIEGGKLN